MCFYGIADLFLSFYLWCTIMWNTSSGYNQFDKRKEMVHRFHWGFPGGNCHIQFFTRDIQAICMEVQEGIYPRRIIYMKIMGQRNVPIIRIGKDLALREMEKKVTKLAHFLHVSIEGL